MRELIFIAFIIYFNINNAFAKDYFNPQFLGSDAASLEDLSYITSGNQLSPGDYFLYLYSGEEYLKSVKIKFLAFDGTVQPCFTNEIVGVIPFSENYKKKINSSTSEKNRCIDMVKYINNFSYEVDMSKLIIRLSIPQIYLDSTLSTMAPENEWDDGIAGFITNYNYNGSYSKNDDHKKYSSNYINLNNRANIGPWRINANVYFNESKLNGTSSHQVNSNGIYISRRINSLKSELLLGQSTIGSGLFNANTYTGMSLATSSEMLQDSDKGYSPAIRGIAESRSKLTIKQNNAIIYQTYVNPGPYNIDNLSSVGSSGDYDVELTSAEGLKKKYSVPYSALPNLLRPGKYNYAVTLGKLDLNSSNDVNFFQSTVNIGIPFDSTLLIGTQYAENYRSLGVGAGRDFGSFGALSFDALHAVSVVDNDKFTGSSYRILYSKMFNETGTNFQLNGYRYSTSNYYSLSEASRRKKLSDRNFVGYYYGRRKDSFQINISQSFNDYGQIYLWGNVDSYWRSNIKSKNIQLGWNKTIPSLNNIILSVSYSKKTYSTMTDDAFYLSFSMPITRSNSEDAMYFSNSTNYSKSDYTNSTSLYGNTLDNRLNYNLYQAVNKNSSYSNTNMNFGFKANSAVVRAGISSSSQSKQFDYGVSGGILFHEEGIAFTREANDTAILVEAKGAGGAKINRAGENITINKSGYALIPYATPYHYNEIELDPSSFSDSYDIENKIAKIAPTRGAISKVTFDVKRGYNFLVSVKYNNKPIKFGTLVKNEEYRNVSIADDDGSVYLTGVKNNSSYTVSLGNNKFCRFFIKYADDSGLKTVNRLSVNCN